MNSQRTIRLAGWCRALTERDVFQSGVMLLIIVNAVLMGIETSPSVMQAYGGLLSLANGFIQAVFVLEVGLRVLAHRPLGMFFRDGWNVFDFTVVAVSLLPAAGSFATVARLARVLRVARLVSLSPDLRLIIGTMLRSIPSMGHVVALLAILLYVYGILGYQLFHAHDPVHWGTLGTALLSLFQVLTLEGWVDMQRTAMAVYPWAWLYFASFVIIAVFVVTNLFIAVVLNNLQTVKSEQALLAAEDSSAPLRRNIAGLRQCLDAFEAALEADRRS